MTLSFTVKVELKTADFSTLLIKLTVPFHNSKMRLQISHMFRCARIQGLDTVEGLLLFGKEHLYVVDGFTLLKSREIRDIESIPLEAYDPILPASGAPTSRPANVKKHCSKFAYDDIRYGYGFTFHKYKNLSAGFYTNKYFTSMILLQRSAQKTIPPATHGVGSFLWRW